LGGAAAKLIAAIWDMMAVWLAASWLIAAVISALAEIVAADAAPIELPTVTAAAVWGMVTIVFTVSSSVSSSCVSNAL
jgi:hypothetical protein